MKTLANETTRHQFQGRGWLSDPGYADSENVEYGMTYTWAGVPLGDITGLWEIEAVRGDGNRCMKFKAHRLDGVVDPTKRTEHTVGVDAGLMAIFNESDVGYDWSSICNEMFGPDYSDGETILYDLEEFVATSTGYGDGSYPVVVERDRSGNAVQVTVDFGEDDLLDEDEGF